MLRNQYKVHITPWKNSCGLSSQAYYLVQELLDGQLTPDQENQLCQWVSDYYAIPVNAKELRQLLTDPDYFPSPFHHQFIMGPVLEAVAKKLVPHAFNANGTTNYPIFDVVAKHFDRRVVIEDVASREIYDSNAVLKTKSTKELRVCYSSASGRGAHYDVLVADQAKAKKANRWESLASGDRHPDVPAKTIRDLPRDNADGMKQLLRASINQIQKKSKKATASGKPATVAPADVKPATVAPADVKPATVAPADVKPATVAPADVKPATVAPADVKPATVAPADVKPATVAPHKPSFTLSPAVEKKKTSAVASPAPTLTPEQKEKKKHNFLQIQAEVVAEVQKKKESEWSNLVEKAKKEDATTASLALKPDDNNKINYSLPDVASPLRVTRETQIALDAELARKLQQEFYSASIFSKKNTAKTPESDTKPALHRTRRS